MPETSGIEPRIQRWKGPHPGLLCSVCKTHPAVMSYFDDKGQMLFLCEYCSIETEVNPSSRYDK